VTSAVRALRGLGATLLNQSVLLAGVNDSCQALENLSTGLFDIGVLPYYLHQLDPVAGATHFQVEDTQAIRLLRELRDRLPGYLVPQLVREIPGAAAKQPLPC
jgi:L-lysine 2,3-aminomutase